MDNTTSETTSPARGHGVDADPPQPIYRPAHDRMLAGVASGMARYLGVDVVLVRICLVALCFVGGVGLAIYLAGWLLIPEEGADRSIAAALLSDGQAWRQ